GGAAACDAGVAATKEARRSAQIGALNRRLHRSMNRRRGRWYNAASLADAAVMQPLNYESRLRMRCQPALLPRARRRRRELRPAARQLLTAAGAAAALMILLALFFVMVSQLGPGEGHTLRTSGMPGAASRGPTPGL